MTDLIQFKAAAEDFLRQAFENAEAGKFSLAIHYAWRAEANAALFAKELERLRVEKYETAQR